MPTFSPTMSGMQHVNYVVGPMHPHMMGNPMQQYATMQPMQAHYAQAQSHYMPTHMPTHMHMMQHGHSAASALGFQQGYELDGQDGMRRSRMRDHRRSTLSMASSQSRSPSRGSPYRKRRSRAAPAGSDDEKISPSYKFMGAPHMHGERCVVPKARKHKALLKINPKIFSTPKLSVLTHFGTDLAIYLTTGVLLVCQVRDLKAKTEGHFYEVLVAESESLLRRMPDRLQHLQSDLSNLFLVARHAGYPAEFIEGAGATFIPGFNCATMSPTAQVDQHNGARPTQALANAAQSFPLPLGMAEPDKDECQNPPEPLPRAPPTEASAAEALTVAPDAALQLYRLAHGVKHGEGPAEQRAGLRVLRT